MILHSTHRYGLNAVNRLPQIQVPGIEGARALLESFYYAFNNRDMDVLRAVWAEDELIQLNNSLGGILRGYEPIAGLYQRVFTRPAVVWVELGDIVEFQSDAMVAFAGREIGRFSQADTTLQLSIRTSRIMQWFGAEIGWRQVHHHGSMDNAQLLDRYQQAVYGG